MSRNTDLKRATHFASLLPHNLVVDDKEDVDLVIGSNFVVFSVSYSPN
jgi:hypothetical protein